MLPYFALLAIFAIGALVFDNRVQDSRRPLLLLSAASVLMAAMIGLRYRIGPDWDGYEAIWAYGRLLGLDGALRQQDPGFYLLQWAVQALDGPLWALNLACASIFTAGLLSFARRRVNPWLAMAVAIPYLVVAIAMSAVRQSTAIGFLFFALVAFSEQRLIRTMFWILVASTFHASASLMLIVLLLSYSRNRFQAVVLLLVSIVPAYYLLQASFETYVTRYGEPNAGSQGAVLRAVIDSIPALIFLLRERQFSVGTNERHLWRVIALMAVLGLLIAIEFPTSTALDRFTLYLTPIQIYVWSELPEAFAGEGKSPLALRAAVLSYLGVALFVFLSFSTYAYSWIPYRHYQL